MFITDESIDNYNIDTLFEMSTSSLFTAANAAPTDQGAYEEGTADHVRIGRSNKYRTTGILFRGIDVAQAHAKPVPITNGSNAMMSPSEANAANLNLLRGAGLENELDSVKMAFLNAVFISLAINSSSVAVPDRATFTVAGSTFSHYHDIVVPLGNDVRRYSRAHADVICDLLKAKIALATGGGPLSNSSAAVASYESACELLDHIKRIAAERDLSRVPHLIHDTADYCTRLDMTERQFLAASKTTTLRGQSDVKGRNHVDNARMAPSSIETAPSEAFANDY